MPVEGTKVVGSHRCFDQYLYREPHSCEEIESQAVAGHTSLRVGDGINDAPASATATVGFDPPRLLRRPQLADVIGSGLS